MAQKDRFTTDYQGKMVKITMPKVRDAPSSILNHGVGEAKRSKAKRQKIDQKVQQLLKEREDKQK